ncbi:MAG: hypothetical protein KAJ39_09390 [Gammaproteobacteria bacterium]|nr:hypothetical protein [Gammaproteobacteria bacterium]
MNILKDETANVEMIPKAVYVFISTAVLYTTAMVFPPSFQIVHALADTMDTSGSLYYDVGATFDVGVMMWYFFLVMIIAWNVVHLGLLAIKRQRYTGEMRNDSDF